MYKEVENILPRTLSKDVKELCDERSSLLEGMVNFGTQISKWDSVIHREGEESLIGMLFFRNILELGDSISILVKQSSVDPCKIIIRSLLENYLSLEYLFNEDEERKALSYIVWNTHRRLKLYDKLDESTQVGRQFKAELKKDKLVGRSTFGLDNEILEGVKANDHDILKMEKYEAIENEYQRTLNQIKNPNWYSLFGGPRNIEQLAKVLNLHAFYEILYRDFSGYVHSNNVFQGKLAQNDDGTTSIFQIRYPKDIQSIVQNTSNILLLSYKTFCINRLPNKTEEFAFWYEQYYKNKATQLLNKTKVTIKRKK